MALSHDHLPERRLVFISISLTHTFYVCTCMHVHMCVYICQKDLIFIFSLCCHSWIDYTPTQNCWFSMLLKLRKIHHCTTQHVKSLSHARLFVTPWTVAYQVAPSMGFSRQEYWSGMPLPSPGDLANPGTEPGSPTR